MTRQSASGAGKWKEGPLGAMALSLPGEETHENDESMSDQIHLVSESTK